MQKTGKRIILGMLGVLVVGAVCVVVYLQGSPWVGNKRTISHPDGSRSVFVRTPDHRTLCKYNYSSKGELSQMAVYRMDEKGNVPGAKICDGRKEELFKVSYGYRKSDGVLVEERMFDSRTKRISPDDGKELPVWRVIHTWNENGSPADRIKIKGQGASDSESPLPEITPFVNPFSI